jgi:predicted hydrocarbon binding protein
MSSLSDRLQFDRQHGAIHDADRRYLLMRADVLMGVLHELPLAAQTSVLQGMAASACKHGGNSVAAYLESVGSAQLQQTMIDSAAALGWGVWHLSATDNSLALDVENSPFAHGHGPAQQPVCAPISGILHSLASALLDSDVVVTEHRCAAQHGGRCQFSARRSDASPSDF